MPERFPSPLRLALLSFITFGASLPVTSSGGVVTITFTSIVIVNNSTGQKVTWTE